MKLALEALESDPVSHAGLVNRKQAITALLERLAQPEQEPVTAIRLLTEQCAALIRERDELQKQVWRYERHGVTCQTYRHKVEQSCSECNVQEKYTPPKQWVGLSDDAVFELADTNLYEGGKNYGVLAFAKAIEQALKEKNT
jgi:hypothetical protein